MDRYLIEHQKELRTVENHALGDGDYVFNPAGKDMYYLDEESVS